MTKIKLPKVFFRDHSERDLPTPAVLTETTRHVLVCSDDAAMAELLDDARHYADPKAIDCEGWLRRAAQAMLAAVQSQTAA